MNATLAMAGVLLAGALAGCSTPEGPRVDVTLGQQLIELKEARDNGALTQKEYERQKKRLIDNAK